MNELTGIANQQNPIDGDASLRPILTPAVAWQSRTSFYLCELSPDWQTEIAGDYAAAHMRSRPRRRLGAARCQIHRAM